MLVNTWQDFARITIETNDLDPSYVFLYNARAVKGDDWTSKFLMHYLCFYDLGEAAKAADLTDQDNFWTYVKFGYPDFRRGTERRHSRGDKGLEFITNLSAHGTPKQVWYDMWAPTFTELTKLFQDKFKGCGFGPYFIWKVLDFQERVCERRISLSLAEAVRGCPDDPRKCAAALWPHLPFPDAMEKVAECVSKYRAPPNFNRNCSYQEAETVLCMLKGYFLSKTHTIGDDVDSKYQQLASYPDLIKFLPPKLNWSVYERGELVPS